MKLFKIAAAGCLALFATGCLFSPGRFDAGMTVMKDGTFSYRYAGEIFLLNAAAAMNASAEEEAQETFDPESQTCLTDETLDERKCTEEEIAERRSEFEENKARKAQQTKEMIEALGGINPKDPATMQAFAKRLEGHDGWKKVAYKSDGLFEVEYETRGRLDREFVFPVFDSVSVIIPFVQVTRRDNGAIHIAAPAFLHADKKNMFDGSFLGAAATADSRAKPFMRPTGTFTIRTDAEILTNNTRDGPVREGNARILKWEVGPLETNQPEALLLP
ncbi:hypothetical protein IC614_11870 [Allosphingosinicella flava]|uniref:Lipoprotein n=1 Tax=Allosphingosinicella flava TaxID=2771430 RepID=A0A7T2GJE8_9SPHN|nr:hypothetical protein [Sphingosinicella flava]QPQ54987.1 hypothetical protein IC614_11870 [Sphingosinicella flava]